MDTSQNNATATQQRDKGRQGERERGEKERQKKLNLNPLEHITERKKEGKERKERCSPTAIQEHSSDGRLPECWRAGSRISTMCLSKQSFSGLQQGFRMKWFSTDRGSCKLVRLSCSPARSPPFPSNKNMPHLFTCFSGHSTFPAHRARHASPRHIPSVVPVCSCKWPFLPVRVCVGTPRGVGVCVHN